MTKKLLGAVAALLALSAQAGPVIPTTIVDGNFAPETAWYTMQIHNAGYYFTNEVNAKGAMPLTVTSPAFNKSEQWCFVGNDTDGYQIYNRAEGTSKMLAAPTAMSGAAGSTSYPTLKAPGIDGQCYNWVFTPSTNITGAYYMGEKGFDNNRVNYRDGVLAFWTGGADAGSSVRLTEAQAKMIGNELVVNTEPRVTLTGSTAPVLNSDGMFELGNCLYKFQSPEGQTVHNYTIKYADGTIVNKIGRGESNDDLAIQGPATVENIIVTVLPTVLPSDNGYIVFRYDGTLGYTIPYRIPSIVTVLAGPHKGRIYSVNDYRYCGGDIGGGRIDLYQSYSDDNGKTWTTPDVMRGKDGTPVAMGTGKATPAGTKQSETNLDCGFGDPATVCDRETGELFMVACAGRMNFFSSRRADPQPSARWWSTDGGETWTEPDFKQWEQIYSLFDDNCKYGYIDGQFIGSGRMVQSSKVKVGSHYRIYAVMSGRNAEAGNISNWVLYSDDFGHNWQILGDPYQPAISYNADEPKCEELPDGSILLAARGNGGGRNFNIFRYTDIENGKGIWDEQINTNLGTGHGINACNGEIMIIPVKNAAGEKAHLAIQSFPNSTAREKVTLAYKALRSITDYDKPSDFATWDGFYQLTPLPSCYSTMTLQDDHTLGIMFEEGTFTYPYVDKDGKDQIGRYNFCEIYRNLSIEDLTNGAWQYDEDPVDNTDQLHKEAVTNRAAEIAAMSENIVGNPTADAKEAVKQAADAFFANPTDATYGAFFAAVGGMEFLQPVSGGIYSFRSAHGGTYNIQGDRWLTAGASALSTTSSESNRTRFSVFKLSDDATAFVIYNHDQKRYVSPTPDKTETVVSTTAKQANAGLYDFTVNPGKVSIVCQNGGHKSYYSIHMNSGQKPVIWTVDAAASKWEMSFLGMDSDLPKNEENAIEEITAGENAPTLFYDLQGRPVAHPRHGQLLITDTRRKLIAE